MSGKVLPTTERVIETRRQQHLRQQNQLMLLGDAMMCNRGSPEWDDIRPVVVRVGNDHSLQTRGRYGLFVNWGIAHRLDFIWGILGDRIEWLLSMDELIDKWSILDEWRGNLFIRAKLKERILGWAPNLRDRETETERQRERERERERQREIDRERYIEIERQRDRDRENMSDMSTYGS